MQKKYKFCKLSKTNNKIFLITESSKLSIVKLQRDIQTNKLHFRTVIDDLDLLCTNHSHSDNAEENKEILNLKNVDMTYKNGYVVFVLSECIVVLDPITSAIISKVNIENLTNSKKFIRHLNIENTNDFLKFTDTNETFLFLNGGFIKKSINFGSQYAFEKIKVNKYLLTGFNMDTSEIVVFNLNQIIENSNGANSPKYPIFNRKVDYIQNMATSEDCQYLAYVESPKLLSLYRLSDSSCIANVSLYSGIHDLVFNGEFVCLAMRDRRVLSLVLVDPLVEAHKNRIKKFRDRLVCILTKLLIGN
jgi:hypothetical protein